MKKKIVDEFGHKWLESRPRIREGKCIISVKIGVSRHTNEDEDSMVVWP